MGRRLGANRAFVRVETGDPNLLKNKANKATFACNVGGVSDGLLQPSAR
jgi:hypothetical protein